MLYMYSCTTEQCCLPAVSQAVQFHHARPQLRRQASILQTATSLHSFQHSHTHSSSSIALPEPLAALQQHLSHGVQNLVAIPGIIVPDFVQAVPGEIGSLLTGDSVAVLGNCCFHVMRGGA